MNSNAKTTYRAILASGLVALAFTHLFALTQVAGWHLDEAWAGNFAHRIAFEKDFWPFQAMSPYTTAWSHYIAALGFKLFGASIFVYRFTGILEVLIGIGLISAALKARGHLGASAFFPAIIAFFPAMVMNHRWVIEMNTFFVLCAGVIAFGLATRRKYLVFTGALFGITSHVLFLAPCLALLYWCWTQGKLDRSTRFTISVFSVLISLFFVRIFLTTQSVDHVKAIALIAISAFVAFGVHIPSPSIGLQKYFLLVPAIIAIPLLVPFFIFAEGTWVALFSSGALQTPFLIGTIFIPVALLLFYRRHLPRKPAPEILWLPLCLILILCMVVKPGPRYYEIPMLFCAVLFAIGVSQLGSEPAKQVLFLWFASGSLQLGVNYFQPAIEETQVDRTFQLGRFHDSSSDMLPIQRVALRLSREGCDYSDLKLSDDRMDECLRFLSYGNWPEPHPHLCSFGTQLDVLRTPGNEGQFTIKN